MAQLRNQIDSALVHIKIKFNSDIHTDVLQYFLYAFALSAAIKVRNINQPNAHFSN